MTVIVFDLDGTISDPAEGITSSINYALGKVNHPTHDPNNLLKFIGPQLSVIFGELLTEPTVENIQQAIDFYRERYIASGYKQNTLYNEIPETLTQLKELGCSLYIATAKREDIAKSVIEHFSLTEFFKGIYGCGSKKQKSQLLEEILEKEPGVSNLVMVGDRSHDMIAGKTVAATCVGVLWGYGSPEELTQSGSHTLISNPAELISFVQEMFIHIK